MVKCELTKRRCTSKPFGFVLFVLAACVVILIEVSTMRRGRVWHKEGSVVHYPDVRLPNKSVKTILLWTGSFLEHPDWPTTRRCLSNCGARCLVTNDKKEADAADAITFHLPNLWTRTGLFSIGSKSTTDFPTERPRQQVWILSNMEPLANLWGDLSIFNGVFNWTRWHRLDSDIPSVYGFKQKLSGEDGILTEKMESKRNYFKEKTRYMFVRVSNCYDSARRYDIVHQFNKHFTVNKYGYCFNNKCTKVTCGPNVLKQYKFHLAFENSHCDDYVTEKYWQSIEREQIPIVNWKYGAFSTVIPESYINVYDFKDIHESIEYIKRVGSNETLYNSYFKYKMKYKLTEPPCSLCTICEALHNSTRQGQVYSDLESWIRDDTCTKGDLWNIIQWTIRGLVYYTSNVGFYW